MFPPIPKPARPVSQRGAEADAILCGAGQNNHGLRLRILEAQPKGNDGAIRGSFVILEPGDNRHAETLSGLVGRVTDAQEVLTLIRQKHPSCVSVVNAGTLVAEADRPPKRAEGVVSDPDQYAPAASEPERLGSSPGRHA